ncbi:hypothetical protein HDV00_009770 [Rhizophlyctis rosea]|nr:hypothetical protein HDV00_009770 [Rhizophlyctis rosea]
MVPMHPVPGPSIGGFGGPTVGGFGPYGESITDQRRTSGEYGAVRRSHSRADSHSRPMSPAPGYYAARRMSRQAPLLPLPQSPTQPLPQHSLPPRVTSPLPVAPSPLPTLASPVTGPTSPLATGSNTISKDELNRINSKILAELNMKNKIIYDLKVKGDWLSAEVVAMKREHSRDSTLNGDLVGDADHSDKLKEHLDRNEEMEDVKVKLFQTLLAFKKELARAQNAVEQGSVQYREADRKRAAAEEEVAYLQGLLSKYSSHPPGTRTSTASVDLALNVQRTTDLEHQLKSAQNDMATLQSKVALWSRASKRNQEARIAAEACQKHAEAELVTAKASLKEMKESEEALRKRCADIEDRVRAFEAIQSDSAANATTVIELRSRIAELEQLVVDRDNQVRAHELALEGARKRIKEFEETIQEASTMMEELEKENRVLRDDVRSKESRCIETDKRLAVIQSEFKELVKIQSVNAEELQEYKRLVNESVPKQDYESLMGQLNDAHQQMEEARGHWTRQVEVLGGAHREASDGWRACESQCEELREKLGFASEAIGELARKEKEWGGEREELRGRVEGLEGERGELEAQAARLQAELDDARKALDDQKQAPATDRELATSDSASPESTARIQSLEEELEVTKQNLAKAHDELDRLIADLTGAGIDASTLSRTAGAVKQDAPPQPDIDALRAHYESQIASLTTAHLEAINTAEQATQQFEEVVLELANVKSRLADAEGSTPPPAGDTETVQRLTKQVEEKDEALRVMEEIVAGLTKEVETKRDLVEGLQGQVETNQEMIGSLVEKLQVMEDGRGNGAQRDESMGLESSDASRTQDLELDLAEARATIATLQVRLADVREEAEVARRRAAEAERDAMGDGAVGTLERGRKRGDEEGYPGPGSMSPSRIPTLSRSGSGNRAGGTLERSGSATATGSGIPTLSRVPQQDILSLQTRLTELETVNAQLLGQIAKMGDRMAKADSGVSLSGVPSPGEGSPVAGGGGDDAAEEIDYLRKEVREAKERISELEGEVRGANEQKGVAEAEVEELKGQVESMREKVRRIVKKA